MHSDEARGLNAFLVAVSPLGALGRLGWVEATRVSQCQPQPYVGGKNVWSLQEVIAVCWQCLSGQSEPGQCGGSGTWHINSLAAYWLHSDLTLSLLNPF